MSGQHPGTGPVPPAAGASAGADEAAAGRPEGERPRTGGAHDGGAHDGGAPAPRTAPDLEWHRVHPVTPLVRGWTVIAVLLVIVGQQTVNGLPDGANLLGGDRWWQILVGILAIGLVGLGFAWLAWRMTSYAVDDESVHLHSGVLFRQQRKARLDRLQAIDIVQPLVARFFGLAELKLEVAGGSDSGVKLGFLKEPEAQRLRNELLARAAGIKLAGRGPGTQIPGATTGEGAPDVGQPAPGTGPVGTPAGEAALYAPEAPEQPITTVPPGRLVGSLVRSGATVGLAVGVLALVGVVVGTRELSVLFTALPAALGFGGYLFSRFTREFNFRSALSPDGIRLRHGLLETRSQTIPPGRVQAIKLSQSLLWRGPDWWRVEVNVAGYGLSTDGSENSSLLLPVGTRDEALTALWLVLPDLGTDDPVAVLGDGLAGSGDGAWFTSAPRRARFLDPLSWRRNGYTVTSRALLLRRGRVWRRLEVVPHERTQSLGIQQGPFQRRLRVATFTVHSTPGPVTPMVPHLDERTAGRLMDEQAARAREARAHATPEQWMRPVVVPGPGGETAPGTASPTAPGTASPSASGTLGAALPGASEVGAGSRPEGPPAPQVQPAPQVEPGPRDPGTPGPGAPRDEPQRPDSSAEAGRE